MYTMSVRPSGCELLMSKPRVLIVEDNPTEQKVIAMLADRVGIEAHVVGTAFKALDELSVKHDYAAVLMNWMMPGMDGLECTYRIREFETRLGLHTPIIAVTAKALHGEREICLDAGMDDYLPKPYSLADFEATMRRWVWERQPIPS
jgi:CheY-like chemotaxis protein